MFHIFASQTYFYIVSLPSAGAVLCFLPGWQDIKIVQQKLEEKPHFSPGSQMIVPCKTEHIDRHVLVFGGLLVTFLIYFSYICFL